MAAPLVFTVRRGCPARASAADGDARLGEVAATIRPVVRL